MSPSSSIEKPPSVVSKSGSVRCGGVVVVGRASGLAALLASGDQTGRPQHAQVLAHGARRDLERCRELVGGRLAVPFDGHEDTPLGVGEGGVGGVHGATVAVRPTSSQGFTR